MKYEVNINDLVKKVTHAESVTARYVAVFRLMCQRDPKYSAVFNDPYAEYFADEKGRERAKSVDIHGAVYESVILRLVKIDHAIVSLVKRYDIDQVVLLGSGFDARSARLRLTAPSGRKVRYFEIDHRETLAAKQAAIETIPNYERATYIQYNFMSDDGLANALVKNGFDNTRPALYVWEGVTMYLTEDAVRKTLTDVAEIHNTNIKGNSAHIVFDYFTRQVRQAHEGEPFIWWAESAAIVGECGWNHLREDTLAAVHLNLFGKPYSYKSSANIAICSKLSAQDKDYYL